MKKDTTQNNILIANFLKQTVQPFEFPQFGYIRHNGDWMDKFLDYQLKFHKDWNWIMEVVQTIENLNYTFDVMGKAVSINNSNEMIVDLNANSFKSKIEAVYTACIEFITWYNENKK
jgi:hypothetical protein